jgi:hypothetical protein
MYNRIKGVLFFIMLSSMVLVSCQKEIDGTLPAGSISPESQKPVVGTIWTYRYYIYHQDGSLYQSFIITHKAKSEITLGGEKWLNIIDTGADTTVYYLNVKPDGLYQYANNTSNLFCKDPASAGDTYNTFNEGMAESFFVRTVNDTLPTGIGNIATNYYEGYKFNVRIDLIWYNKNAWIVRKTQYRNRSLITPVWYKYSTLFLDRIIY